MYRETTDLLLFLQVQRYCNCTTNSGECTSLNAASGDSTSTSQSDQCLLYNLEVLLKEIKLAVGGDHVTCRRADATQHRVLRRFHEAVDNYNKDVNAPVRGRGRPTPVSVSVNTAWLLYALASNDTDSTMIDMT